MPVLGYDSSLDMALSDGLSFPDKKDAPESGDLSAPIEIEEGQSYFAKFYSNEAPLFLKEAKFYQRELPDNIHELNFKNFVGLSRIGQLKLYIRNKKISDDLYEAMLDEIAGHYASLVFSFSTPAGQHYQKATAGKDSAFLEYLFLKKYMLDETPDIEALTNIFLYNPHRKIEKEQRRCPVQECHEADANILSVMLGSPMAALRQGHSLQSTSLAHILERKTGRTCYPVEAARIIKYQSVDTNENRFIKFFLKELLWKIESISTHLTAKRGSYFNPDIGERLDSLRNKTNHFLSHNMWQEVGPMEFLPANSQVLQRRDGYRQLFSLYSLLQLATHCDFLKDDFQALIEIKDVPTLYEYWCFFQIKAVIDSLSTAVKVGSIIYETPTEHNLTRGLCVEYQNGSRLYFNKTYSGSNGIKFSDLHVSLYRSHDSSSHNFRPDIVIEKNDQKLIFDAKYKGKRVGFYCEEEDGTIQSWKDEDIDKMHTYREAIKNVAGSFIMFPGCKSVVYPAHGSDLIFKGVGALPVRPNLDASPNNADLEAIKSLISKFFIEN